MRICNTPKCNEEATHPSRFGDKCHDCFYAFNLVGDVVWKKRMTRRVEDDDNEDDDGRQQLGLFEDDE